MICEPPAVLVKVQVDVRIKFVFMLASCQSMVLLTVNDPGPLSVPPQKVKSNTVPGRLRLHVPPNICKLLNVQERLRLHVPAIIFKLLNASDGFTSSVPPSS